MANGAVRALGDDWDLYRVTDLPEKGIWQPILKPFKANFNYWRFQTILAISSLGFWVSQSISYFRWVVFGVNDGGFESVLDKQAKKSVFDKYGLNLEFDA